VYVGVVLVRLCVMTPPELLVAMWGGRERGSERRDLGRSQTQPHQNYSVAFLAIAAKLCSMCSAEVLFVQYGDRCLACWVCIHRPPTLPVRHTRYTNVYTLPSPFIPAFVLSVFVYPQEMCMYEIHMH
jgi:hypothetical protein